MERVAVFNVDVPPRKTDVEITILHHLSFTGFKNS